MSRVFLFLLLGSLSGGCGTRVVRTVAIVPKPCNSSLRHVPVLSRVAAERVRREIGERGFAAVLPGSTARPESCLHVTESESGADLVIHVWVQQVDLPLPAFPGERPRTWGGLVLRDSGGRDLASARFLTRSPPPGKPSDSFHFLASPDDPKAVMAADAFGAWVLGSPGRFSAEVERVLGDALAGGDP